MRWLKDNYPQIILIFFVSVLVFSKSLNNGFVWDDEEQIINNVLVHSVANWKVFFSGGAFYSGNTTELLGAYYKPLMTLSFSVIYTLFGNNPFYYHLFSIIIHFLNTILVFVLFSRYFEKNKSLLLSLIFLSHPLYSEVVFYAANFQDLLFFFFGMIALLSNKTVVIYLALLMSLLSKETGIVFVIVSPTLKFLEYGYKTIKQNKKLYLILLVAPIFSFLTYLYMRLGIANIGLTNIEINPLASQNIYIRLMSLPKIIFYYLQNLIYPVNLVANQHWYISNIDLYNFWLPLTAVLAFFSLISIPILKSTKNYLFFFLLFILSFGIHFQIVPLDVTVSGRWFYLPMVGLLGMLGFIFKDKYFKYLIAISIIIFSLITLDRSYDWRSGLTLYSNDIKIVKDDFNLENNLGVEMYRIGKINEAHIHFQKSVELAPFWWTNWNNLGVTTEYFGDIEKATEYYKKAINNGGYYLAVQNYNRIKDNKDKNK
ncbi:MAG: tetratricopeptide repeat protein [Microgenomates group bacterium]